MARTYLITKSGAGIEVDITDKKLELLHEYLDKGDYVTEVEAA